ncbi:MAG TPA: DUF1761 domain-containing protein [Allosphingosinicella sp.]|nr:DUF1761 domain-containing protein [Allosphingosinicella sp.]
MPHVNWVAAVVAGIVGYFPGALWYSPLMFLNAWRAETGLSGEQGGLSMGARLASGVALSLVAALAFAVLIGPEPTLAFAVEAALAIAICFITTAFGMQYLFEGRSVKLTLINGGFHIVQFLIYAIILGLWH